MTAWKGSFSGRDPEEDQTVTVAKRRSSLTGTVLANEEQRMEEQKRMDRDQARKAMLILPNSIFLKLWLAVIGPLIVYNVIWIPLEVSQMAVADTVHSKIDFVLDFFFYVDIFVNFRTAFINKENELVLEPRVIAKRYLYGSFLVDLVATLHWEVFLTGITPFHTEQQEGSAVRAVSVLRLPRLLRLLRLFKKLDVFPKLTVVKVRERRPAPRERGPATPHPHPLLPPSPRPALAPCGTLSR